MKVLIIEHDPDVIEVVSLCLGMRWPQTTVMAAIDGTEGLSLAKAEKPDVVILDVDLPDMDGFEVCRKIRRFSNVPIIMLGISAADTDVSRALEIGADDYVTKPIRHIELLSRIQAVLRRVQKLPLSKDKNTFRSSNLTIDYDAREVQVNGEMVKLTPIEYDLLYYLTQNVGRVQTYESLLTKVWGEQYKHEKNLLKLPIHNLRRKLGDNPSNPGIIVNERSIGYRFLTAN